VLREKRGWLLRLTDAAGPAIGWGEAAPLEEPEVGAVADVLEGWRRSGPPPDSGAFEALLPQLPPCLAFAVGAALAELEGQMASGWLDAPPSARLLPAGEVAVACLEPLLAAAEGMEPLEQALTVKWKVAAAHDRLEREVLEQLLQRLPPSARLRLDANGGWNRATASAWADRLAAEPRLAWLEQPLDPDDLEGLSALAERIPVALDESLQRHPELRGRWPGWQVRRPSQEGDPRPMLARLRAGAPPEPHAAGLALSTAFETGIARRWLSHLAALQALGPAPVVPGLAPGWQPAGNLASPEPERVWQAAQP
jgi:O-succinylbenzoate synthase